MEVTYDPILNALRKKDESEGSPFDPSGVYPKLIAGGILSRETDAIKDNRTSFIFRTAGGSASISNGYAKLTELFGNVINGIPFNASQFKAIGFNAFNPNNIMNKTIDEQGNITDSEDHKVAYIHVVAGQVGAGKNNGYIISSKDNTTLLINRVAFTTTNPTLATTATILNTTSIDTTRNAYIPPMEGYLLIDCFNAQLADMCVHLAWSYNPQNYADYSESILQLPQAHTWGLGKAGNIMDEINLLDQIITTRIDRELLSAMTWIEQSTSGNNAYSDSHLTTPVGEIISTTDTTITVENTTYDRYTAGDTDSSFAWKNEDNIIYTASDTPCGKTYSYTSDSIATKIKNSTTNIDCYGLNPLFGIAITNDCKVVISTGQEHITPTVDFQGIYLYYELATYIITSETLDPIYIVDDFGTEEFIGSPVPPTYATFFYLQNLYDGIRQVIATDDKQRSYTVEFGATATLAQDVNVEGANTIDRVKTDNIASLRITTGTYIQHSIQLINGEANVSIPVADGAIVTWEITRINANQIAVLGVRYKL